MMERYETPIEYASLLTHFEQAGLESEEAGLLSYLFGGALAEYDRSPSNDILAKFGHIGNEHLSKITIVAFPQASVELNRQKLTESVQDPKDISAFCERMKAAIERIRNEFEDNSPQFIYDRLAYEFILQRNSSLEMLSDIRQAYCERISFLKRKLFMFSA